MGTRFRCRTQSLRTFDPAILKKPRCARQGSACRRLINTGLRYSSSFDEKNFLLSCWAWCGTRKHRMVHGFQGEGEKAQAPPRVISAVNGLVLWSAHINESSRQRLGKDGKTGKKRENQRAKIMGLEPLPIIFFLSGVARPAALLPSGYIR